MGVILEVRQLEKWYGRRKVVDGVCFQVEEGEVVGLLGPNGAGKTTSFRMTTGQITPQGGHVLFNGQDVTYLPMYRRARLGMGYLSQETSVFRKLSVEQNILAILEAMPFSRNLARPLTRIERWDRTDEILGRFGLLHVRKNVAGRLSGGEKRRLEIARCLVCEPLLILLDEPFTGIDPKTIGDIQKIVIELRNSGISILLTDHNVRETLKITNRSYLIKDGKVATHGTPLEWVHDPIAIRDYLGTGFHDDMFSRPPPPQELAPPPASIDDVPPERAVQLFMEQEKIHRTIERLGGEDHTIAAIELVERGMIAVPSLLDALERREVELRAKASNILRQIVGVPIRFDPYAPDHARGEQVAALRHQLVRKAG